MSKHGITKRRDSTERYGVERSDITRQNVAMRHYGAELDVTQRLYRSKPNTATIHVKAERYETKRHHGDEMAYKKGWRRKNNKQKRKAEARPEPKPKPVPKPIPKPRLRKVDPNRHPNFTDWWYSGRG